jgi:hypothetical protein
MQMIQLHSLTNAAATKTVLVLGAGASHGSQFADDSLRPPLICDFFACAKALAVFDRGEFEPLWRFIENEIGLAQDRLIELEASNHTSIEQIYSLVQDLDLDPKGPHRRLVEKLLYEVITTATQPYKTRSCGYHDTIFRALRPALILSFNYDLIADRSLESVYPGWELSRIARFDQVYDGEQFVSVKDYLKGRTVPSEEHFPRYTKVHGSLNHYYYEWLFERTRARSRWEEMRTSCIVPLEYAFDTGRINQSRPRRDYAMSTRVTSTDWAYDNQRAELQLDHVPPTHRKTFKSRSEDFDGELAEAERIVFIGYSLADTDLEAITWFRRAYNRHQSRSLLRVEVVNKDQTVLEKLKAIYYESNVSKAADTLAEFAEDCVTN